MSRFTCAFIVLGLSVSWSAVRGQTVGEQIIASLDRYRVAVLESDIEHVVSSFTEDGELSEANEPVVQGRTTIRALMNARRSIKVVAFDMRATATRVEGASAVQNGFYSQRVVAARNQSTVLKGMFEVHWSRQADGAWLINRLEIEQVE